MLKNIWVPAIAISVAACAAVFAFIVGFGELLLFLDGDAATAGALVLLFGITIVAAIAAKKFD